MTKKTELRNQNKDLVVDFFELINSFDFSKTNKFTNFLIKEFRKSIKTEPETFQLIGDSDSKFFKKTDCDIKNNCLRFIERIYDTDNLEILKRYSEHLDAHRIQANKRDINQLEGWDELSNIVSVADALQNKKRLEKETIVVFEDSEYLIIKPLSFEASLVYGSGTKWCTAMKRNSEYFYRYSHAGVLSYLIDKNNNKKFAFMFDIAAKDFSIWSVEDRRIDSIETGLPEWLIRLIYNYSLVEQNNHYYFSDKTKKESALSEKKGFLIEEAEPMEIQDNGTYYDNLRALDDYATDLRNEIQDMGGHPELA